MKRNPMIVKSSGEKMPFAPEKLRKSLLHSGAPSGVVDTIVQRVSEEIYEEMSTREIYNRAFSLLRKYKEACASRYKLKKAIYELGPTGFPFERFVSAVLNHSGHKTRTNQIYKGHCVDHEIDVVAENTRGTTLIECKFHSDEGKKCDVKIPLYIHSRFRDIERWNERRGETRVHLKPAWVVTNTRFTRDAEKYGKCAGLYLLSWNHPPKNSLKRRIDRSGLYPITVSTLLSAREKEFLLGRGVVLCKELLGAPYLLDHMGISDPRKKRILFEFTQLSNVFSTP
ncbi:MAG: ATPase [Bacteroidetes bacterium]|nr:MAG: ATPase [Bacteroidota bacterium]